MSAKVFFVCGGLQTQTLAELHRCTQALCGHVIADASANQYSV